AAAAADGAAGRGADVGGVAAAGVSVAGAGSAFLSCASATPPRASDAHSAMRPSRRFIGFSPLSKCVGAGLAGADADDLLEVEHEDLSVADLPGVGALLDRLDDAVEHVVLDGRLHLHLGEEIDDVLGAAVELGVSLLAAKALHLGHRDALHADRRQGFAHLVELERLDDRRYEFHGFSPIRTSTTRSRRGATCS